MRTGLKPAASWWEAFELFRRLLLVGFFSVLRSAGAVQFLAALSVQGASMEQGGHSLMGWPRPSFRNFVAKKNLRRKRGAPHDECRLMVRIRDTHKRREGH